MCSKCSNVNLPKCTECNRCKAPKVGVSPFELIVRAHLGEDALCVNAVWRLYSRYYYDTLFALSSVQPAMTLVHLVDHEYKRRLAFRYWGVVSTTHHFKDNIYQLNGFVFLYTCCFLTHYTACLARFYMNTVRYRSPTVLLSCYFQICARWLGVLWMQQRQLAQTYWVQSLQDSKGARECMWRWSWGW